jgi:uncharacterized OsmC-like protein
MISTIKVDGTWKGGYRIDVKAGDHILIIDQPEAFGGKNEGPNPLEYFLFSLAGCLGAVAAIIARQERIELKAFNVSVEGDIDKAFLMGKTEEGRAGFTEIRVDVDIDADMTDAEKQAFFHKVDSRCPISDNMVKNTNVVFSVK